MPNRLSRLVRRAARWGGCRFVSGGVILGYHRIAAEPDDPWHLCVRPDHFAEQLEVLVRRMRPVRLDALAADRQPGPREVAITFDDAYLDVLLAALPVLERFGIPATVFVVTDALGTSFWWDRVVALQRAAPPAKVTVTVPAVSGMSGAGTITVDSRRPVPAALRTMFRTSSDAGRSQVLEQLREGFGLIDLTGAARTVTADELQRLAAHPLIEIGAHTRTHPDLARLTTAQVDEEVRGSRQSLGDLLGRDVGAFAYPHGSVSPGVRTAVQRAGFALACAGDPGRVRQDTDRLTLPRLWPADVDGEGFERFLRRWTGN